MGCGGPPTGPSDGSTPPPDSCEALEKRNSGQVSAITITNRWADLRNVGQGERAMSEKMY